MKQVTKKAPWFIAQNLTPETTEENLHAHLRACGIEVPFENLSVKTYAKYASCIIALTNENIADILNHTIAGRSHLGKPVVFRPWLVTRELRDQIMAHKSPQPATPPLTPEAA